MSLLYIRLSYSDEADRFARCLRVESSITGTKPLGVRSTGKKKRRYSTRGIRYYLKREKGQDGAIVEGGMSPNGAIVLW